MGPQARREYLESVRKRYHQYGKKAKSSILDEFCANCGYHRKHAIRLLGVAPVPQARRPGPPRRYGPELLEPLRQIWMAAEQPCSKRLAGALPIWLPKWEAREGKLSREQRRRLRAISPATIDRLLRPVRAALVPHGHATTRPGSLLRQHIPVHTGPWDTDRPGYLEADTVAHGGSSGEGEFIWSITYTDIASGWTQCRAVLGRGAAGVVDQTRQVEAALPFALLGLDCDNGSEFLNHHLLDYLRGRASPVAFTRCRPYKKNDQAHVEQKNWTHVRQLLGYERLASPELVAPINHLYEQWCELHNFFIPNLKLRDKRRVGGRTVKRYEPAQTPCERLQASPWIDRTTKRRLREQQRQFDPFELKKHIEHQLKLVFALKRRTEGSTALPASSLR